jgi:hypothetical protein
VRVKAALALAHFKSAHHHPGQPVYVHQDEHEVQAYQEGVGRPGAVPLILSLRKSLVEIGHNAEGEDNNPSVKPAGRGHREEGEVHDCPPKLGLHPDPQHVGEHIADVVQEENHCPHSEQIDEEGDEDEHHRDEVMQQELVIFSISLPLHYDALNYRKYVNSQLRHVEYLDGLAARPRGPVRVLSQYVAAFSCPSQ